MTSTALDAATAVAVLAARVLRARRRRLQRAAGDDDQGDEGDHAAEDNTYNLPDGEPIADELRDWLAKQRAAVLAAIPDATLPTAFPDLTAADWVDPMATRMTPLLASYWDESGKEVYSRLGLDPNEWRVVNPHLRDQIYSQSFAFCQSTNDATSLRLGTALARLKDHFAAGLATEGETVRQLTGRVQSIFDGLSTSHARMIAATEASRAVHAAELTADLESEVVAGLELLLSSDACPLCRKIATECRRVRLGESFAVIGDNPHYKDIRHPPLHPHCQCTIIEVLKPEYGGPVAPQWGHALQQPQHGLGAEYVPPAGHEVPKPEPGRPKPRPTKPPPKAPFAPTGPTKESIEADLGVKFAAPRKGDAAVVVSIPRLDAELAKDEGYHVGLGGSGPSAKPGAYDRFHDFLVKAKAEGIAVEMPRVILDADGEPIISDGRHRWAVWRDMGLAALPIAVPTKSDKIFAERFGPK